MIPADPRVAAEQAIAEAFKRMAPDDYKPVPDAPVPMEDETMNTKWWHFYQNNSGGSFDHDPDTGIGYAVFIEAHSADEASARAQDIGIYFDGVRQGSDCDCCGDRWSKPWGDGDGAPSLYGRRIRPVMEGENPTLEWGIPSYIHPLEGRFSAVVIEDRA